MKTRTGRHRASKYLSRTYITGTMHGVTACLVGIVVWQSMSAIIEVIQQAL